MAGTDDAVRWMWISERGGEQQVDKLKRAVLSMLETLGGSSLVDRAWMIHALWRSGLKVLVRRRMTGDGEGRMTGDGEESQIRAILKPGNVCIDVGAYVGDYSHLCASLVGPSGQVLAVEPVVSSFRVLSNRVKLFRLRNVQCVNVALSETPGPDVEMVGARARPGLRSRSHLRSAGGDSQSVGQPIPVTTLDALVEAQGLDRVDFVKCDVEGAELLVFRGALHTLTTHQPIVFCEIEERWMRYGYDVSDITQFFAHIGYSMYAWDGGQLLLAESVLPSFNNYFFYPPHRTPS